MPHMNHDEARAAKVILSHAIGANPIDILVRPSGEIDSITDQGLFVIRYIGTQLETQEEVGRYIAEQRLRRLREDERRALMEGE